jgi:CheY-like chemotaxis protein
VKRILFVDDEQNVLTAIGLELRKERARWTIVFAVGASAAIDALQGEPFDVVVSDLRMAGMDGVAFLTRVRATWPNAARVVLSGSAWKSSVDGAGLLAHEVLSKPCSTPALLACLERHLAK